MAIISWNDRSLFCLNSVHVIYSVHLRCLANIKMQDGNYWSARLLFCYMLLVFLYVSCLCFMIALKF